MDGSWEGWLCIQLDDGLDQAIILGPKPAILAGINGISSARQ
jgi:hypothetical protein